MRLPRRFLQGQIIKCYFWGNVLRKTSVGFAAFRLIDGRRITWISYNLKSGPFPDSIYWHDNEQCLSRRLGHVLGNNGHIGASLIHRATRLAKVENAAV
ncbi:Uncharacterized protein HZ326_11934 [Fusarium oxysporum f. sp. albedinis]|nr:Uncharacterized protein HZ326_11934 [Fusarium oxysporum f. sp. albedinis]